MKIMKKVLIALMILGMLPLFACGRASKNNGKQISTALNTIALSYPMILSADEGESIVFSASQFDDVIGVSKVGNIVITALPAESSGVLMLGSLRVMKGQSISRSSLSSLYFEPNAGTESAQFSFCVGETSEYSTTCVMYFLNGNNYAPTSVNIDESFFSIKTFRNIAVSGKMRCADPDGDEVVFEVVSIPEKGLLTVKDRSTGEYVYTPMKNYSGNDSFSYVAVDKYGNRSAEITVDISVKRSENGTVFKDMIYDPAHYGAILLDDLGIMAGMRDDSGDVFMPDIKVTRGDFLVMAMRAAEIKLNSSVPDDIIEAVNELPKDYRACVSTAYINGMLDENEVKEFDCYGTLTKAEACVILDGILDASAPRTIPVFEDIDAVPDYALDAVCALIEIGILSTENGYVQPTDIMTRADVARMLAAVIG